VSPFCARPKQGCDVTNRAEDTSVMAEKKASRSGVTYCAAGGPNKANCPGKTGMPGISMHYFPRDETVRQKWTRFVRINRKDFVPTKSSALCSAHFDSSCFHLQGIVVTDESGNQVMKQKRHIITGSIPSKITVASVSSPSKNTVTSHTSPLTSRKRRNVSLNI